MKILLVEDDPGTVESLAMCFEVYAPGSTFLATSSGLGAIDILKKDSFDLVLLDLGLPEVDGMEVLARIRSFCSIPIIIVSARRNSDNIDKALKSGANQYVTKPFNVKNLFQIIDRELHPVVYCPQLQKIE